MALTTPRHILGGTLLAVMLLSLGEGASSPTDDTTLDDALQAYHQAKNLEESLDKSERAVKAQTKELEGELRKASRQSAGANSAVFRQEEQVDRDLLRSAKRETWRDAKLVRQARGEIQADRRFLDQAYGLREDRCPLFTCSLARLSGAAPEHCTHSSKSCEELSCYKYTHQGTCISTDAGERVHVCQRSERKVPGCAMPVGSATREWSRKECPGMMCAHALDWGYSPIYCTSTDEDVNLCPELGCHQYQPAGTCSGATGQGYSSAHVCSKKPGKPRANCVSGARFSDSKLGQASGGGSRSDGGLSQEGEDMSGVSPLHDQHAGISKWSNPAMVDDRMGILTLSLFMSASAGGAFLLFKRSQVGRQPAPPPAYYGRL